MEVRIRELPNDLHREFKLLCVSEGVTINDKLIELIEEAVRKARK